MLLFVNYNPIVNYMYKCQSSDKLNGKNDLDHGKPKNMLVKNTFKEPSSPYGVVSGCNSESSSISFFTGSGYSGTGMSIIRLDSVSYHDTFPA